MFERLTGVTGGRPAGNGRRLLRSCAARRQGRSNISFLVFPVILVFLFVCFEDGLEQVNGALLRRRHLHTVGAKLQG